MWSELSRIVLTDEWQFSEPSEFSLFRVIQSSQFAFYGLGFIAQSCIDEYVEIFEPQDFFLTFTDVQVFRFRKPPCFLNRTIAVKGKRYRFALGTTVIIEHYLGEDMPLFNPPQFARPSSSVSSTVASSASSVTLLAANASRLGFSVTNKSTAILYLDYDAAASDTDHAVQIQPGGYFEPPLAFTGQISAIWSSVNGSALVREFS